MINRVTDNKFKLVSKYQPSGDQPQAIEQLVDNIEGGEKAQILMGATGTGKTYTMSQVIAQVNQSQQDKHPEVLTGPTILGPQIEKNGRYSFRIAMTAQNGTQVTVYHTYYKLYHDALMEAGINLPTGNNGIM